MFLHTGRERETEIFCLFANKLMNDEQSEHQQRHRLVGKRFADGR